MKNQVIKVLNKEHGKEVLKYWESKGANTGGYFGSATEQGGYTAIYYGFIDGTFNNYEYSNVLKANAEIINLPKENPYPKVMWVWDNNDEHHKLKRVVFMEKLGKYIAWNSAETLDQSIGESYVNVWYNAEDVQEETLVELTLEDISAGKGVGIPVHLLRIKK